MLERQRGDPKAFDLTRAKAYTLAQNVLGYIRFHHGGDPVDAGKLA